jgi:hypothetical protein
VSSRWTLAAYQDHRPAPQSNISAAGPEARARPFDFGNLTNKPIYLRSASEEGVLEFQQCGAAGLVLNVPAPANQALRGSKRDAWTW